MGASAAEPLLPLHALMEALLTQEAPEASLAASLVGDDEGWLHLSPAQLDAEMAARAGRRGQGAAGAEAGEDGEGIEAIVEGVERFMRRQSGLRGIEASSAGNRRAGGADGGADKPCPGPTAALACAVEARAGAPAQARAGDSCQVVDAGAGVGGLSVDIGRLEAILQALQGSAGLEGSGTHGGGNEEEDDFYDDEDDEDWGDEEGDDSEEGEEEEKDGAHEFTKSWQPSVAGLHEATLRARRSEAEEKEDGGDDGAADSDDEDEGGAGCGDDGGDSDDESSLGSCEYAALMEAELGASTLFESFERTPDGQVDVERNLLTHLLEAHASQGGRPGPASALLSQLGLRLPDPPPLAEAESSRQ